MDRQATRKVGRISPFMHLHTTLIIVISVQRLRGIAAIKIISIDIDCHLNPESNAFKLISYFTLKQLYSFDVHSYDYTLNLIPPMSTTLLILHRRNP